MRILLIKHDGERIECEKVYSLSRSNGRIYFHTEDWVRSEGKVINTYNYPLDELLDILIDFDEELGDKP